MGTLTDTHGASDVIESLFLAEITNPFFLTRTMSELFSMEKERFINVNNIIFLVLFTLIRGYLTNKSMYHYLQCSETSLPFSLSLSLLTVVSSYWLFKMLSIAFNMLFGKNAGNKIIRAGRRH
jgi:hypothetical protein